MYFIFVSNTECTKQPCMHIFKIQNILFRILFYRKKLGLALRVSFPTVCWYYFPSSFCVFRMLFKLENGSMLVFSVAIVSNVYYCIYKFSEYNIGSCIDDMYRYWCRGCMIKLLRRVIVAFHYCFMVNKLQWAWIKGYYWNSHICFLP